MKELKLLLAVVLSVVVVALVVLSAIRSPSQWLGFLIFLGIGSIILAILRFMGRSIRLLVLPRTEAEITDRRRVPLLLGLILAIALFCVAIFNVVISTENSHPEELSSSERASQHVSAVKPVQEEAAASTHAAVADVPIAYIPEALKSNGPPARSQPMVARSLSLAPGAIVCPDFQTVGMVFNLFNQTGEDKFVDMASKGQSALIRGRVANAPDPEVYDCILLAPGTPMMFEFGNIVPVVSVQTAGGWIRGVTLANMMVAQSVPTRQQGLAAAQQFVNSIVELKSDFQRKLPTLVAPAPNLRWFPTEDKSVLITPYGPCAAINSVAAGYLYTEIRYSKKGPNSLALFGAFPRVEAELTAENRCQEDYGSIKAAFATTAEDSDLASSQSDQWFPEDNPTSPSNAAFSGEARENQGAEPR